MGGAALVVVAVASVYTSAGVCDKFHAYSTWFIFVHPQNRFNNAVSVFVGDFYQLKIPDLFNFVMLW